MAHAHHSILEEAGLASGLLTQEQIDCAWHAMVDPLRSGIRSLNDLSDDVLSEQLIKLGYLNPWQAEQLRHGRTKFTLGPYRILDAIGHGGMGYVFKGEHFLLGRIEAQRRAHDVTPRYERRCGHAGRGRGRPRREGPSRPHR